MAIQPYSTKAPSISALEQQAGSADWSRWTQNRWCFYDYVRLNPLGTNEINFFVNPIGQNDPVSGTAKTYEQTNLTETRNFGRVNFLLKTIRCHIRIPAKNRQPAALAAATSAVSLSYTPLSDLLLNLSQQGVLLVSLGQKEYFDIPQPFINCPPAFGIDIVRHGGNDAAGAPVAGRWFQMDNDPKTVYNVKPEQLIEAGQTIQMKMAFDNANTPALTNVITTPSAITPVVEIGVIFDGFILRPVQ